MIRLTATMAFFLAVCGALGGAASARNRNPKDYPEQAKVVSFERRPCGQVGMTTGGLVGTIPRVCHVIAFELAEQRLTGSCFHCDPLMPGKTYPARLDEKELVLYVIHQKSNGAWGQDNYAVTELTKEGPPAPDKH